MSYLEQRRQLERRRKRTDSLVVTLGLMSVAALIAYGYSTDCDHVEEVTAVCVAASPAADGSYQVVQDNYCGSHGAYHYYYGGSATGGYARGGTINRPPTSVRVITKSGTLIQRGGFGGRGTSGS
ncbi:hypothetical protein AB0F17_34185 [Nonomuraea sp. NPDC026600]|uniref:hypothetical protein n=1 Tax=Nonomuraea sp. NPDC026600 TaxID=3155363 RepID=UPI00340F0F6F